MDAIEYIKEKERMCNSLSCFNCELNLRKNGTPYICREYCAKYPYKAVEVVEKWSKEHPKKTILSDFLEKYPNAPMATNGTPFELCPHKLGLYKYDECDIANCCVECWNRPLEEAK